MTQVLRFRHRGADRLGVVDGGDYIDVTRAYEALLADQGRANAGAWAAGLLPPDMLAYFDGGAETYGALTDAVAFARSLPVDAAVASGVRVPASDAEILVPIPNPRKIVCVARNFGKHAAEAGLVVSEIPILFLRVAATLVAEGKPIVVPTVSEQVDWEGELAVVIGRAGRHVAKEDAMSYVAGYTIINDVSVRDYQFRVAQYTEGKNFFASAPFGPHISLVDEAIDPHAVRITTTINGTVKQDASTEEFIFDIPTIINEISTFIPLEPGDVIAMGTPAGVGFKRNPPEFLRPGDVIEVAVEGVGVLRNPVEAEGV